MPHRGTRDEMTKVMIYIQIINLSTLAIDTIGHVLANTGSAVSENVSKQVRTPSFLINWNHDVVNTTKGGVHTVSSREHG